ncbi:TraR/DksA family transcriptional regulator [Actibacterium atlanticum]|uniref:TraR/DksA family transcriptional regulator n=1 Tax=Actibacterium atlanticum TaxID=1461693 RepID=A0A058ZLR3_9RHOB|nr:TraR/DksA family transcriptional regulator [Actibacterium atlanticum]KCV81711.1 TraR/DksA family transcriptional regulator [Actibacterium atlanticum]
MVDLSTRKATLLARLKELDVRLHVIQDELDTHNSPDWSELAVEREEDEVLESMGSSGLHEIEQIRAALDRIANDTYGFCVKCGEEIAPQRLDLLPATPFCKRCAV